MSDESTSADDGAPSRPDVTTSPPPAAPPPAPPAQPTPSAETKEEPAPPVASASPTQPSDGGPRTADPDAAALRAYIEATSADDAEQAFAAFVRIFDRRVYSICLRFLRNFEDAEEATQNTLMKVARNAATFRFDSKVSTWVFRIAANASKDLARKNARRPAIPVDEFERYVQLSAPGADQAIVVKELTGEVGRALGQLDSLSRMLIVLCTIEEQPYADVSEMLGIPVGTIKSRISRARIRLAELLEAQLTAVESPAGPGRDPQDGSGPTASARGP